jgi:hypothetical protein
MASTPFSDPSTAAYMQQPQQPAMDPSQQPPVQQPQPPQQQPLDPNTDPVLQAAAVHHSRLASALSAVGDILGGNKSLKLMKNPDGSVSIQQTDATPGEKWGRVAQAALSGAAKGFEVGQGPGGPAKAAAGGIQTGMAMPKQQQDQTLALADRMNDQNRSAQLFKANMALLNQKVIAGAWDQKQKEIAAANGEEDRAATIQDHMQKMNATKFHVADMEDTANAYNSNPELQQAHHDGRTVFFRTFDSKGNVNGGDIYVIPEDKMNKLNEKPFNRERLVWNGNKDEPPKMETFPIDARAMKVKDQMAAWQSDEDANQKTNTAYYAATGELATAKAAELKALGDAATARAANAATAEAAKGTWSLQEDSSGNTVLFNDKTHETQPAPPGLQKAGIYAKNQAAMEKEIGPGRDSTNFANNYLALKHFTGPQDEALMEKYFDLAKPSTGFRMSKPQQDMLKQSQDFYDSLKAKGQHLIKGTWFSDKQREQIVNAMNELYKAKEQGARTVYKMPGGAPTPTPASGGPPTPPAGATGFKWGDHPVVNPGG